MTPFVPNEGRRENSRQIVVWDDNHNSHQLTSFEDPDLVSNKGRPASSRTQTPERRGSSLPRVGLQPLQSFEELMKRNTLCCFEKGLNWWSSMKLWELPIIEKIVSEIEHAQDRYSIFSLDHSARWLC